MKRLFCFPALLWAATISFASAGSATWNLNPSNSDWNTAANWTPATIPNGDDDVATFGLSTQTSITESQTITLARMIFQPDAASYTIMAGAKGTDENLVFVGEGVVNQSAFMQHFQLGSLTAQLVTAIFQNNAQAGTATEFSVGANQDTLVGEDASPAISGGGRVEFFDDSSAAAATFIVKAAASAYRDNGTVDFYDNSSAGNATVIVEGATHTSYSGELTFHDASSPADSTLTAEGASVPGALTGGAINFLSPFLGQGTIIANTGTNGGRGGGIGILPGASGTPRVELFGTGNLGFYGASGTVEIGSLEGDGIVGFSGNHLIVGGNNLSTAFAGLIQDEGSLLKTGTGTFTLSGANTYTEGTAITGGTLVVANTTGSATGTGPVNVSSGTLGGAGIIAGATTIGTGNGSGLSSAQRSARRHLLPSLSKTALP